jgi:WD40 repeat protein
VSNGSNRTWLHVRHPASGGFRGRYHAANSLIRDLTLLADGRTIALVREQEYQGPTPNAVVLGTIGKKFEPLVTAKKKGENTFTSLALHPSGKWLAVGQSDGTVRLFDTNRWREAVAYQWPVKPVAGLAFAPDGLKAAAGGAEGQVVVWDIDL